MITVDDILKISSREEFDRTAIEVFRRQARECAPYREYLAAVGIPPETISNADQIPFLPIELFKTHKVYCGPEAPEAVFSSSSTGGEGPSKHHVARLADYRKTFTRGFELFYGDPREWNIRSLLPCYEERKGSSLIYMVDELKKQGDEGGKPLLIGVSYALLDLAEEFAKSGEKLPPGTVVVETGGMKGRRPEMSKARMHEVLQQVFGVAEIHSEYGMAELMSQAYSTGKGVFRTPPWMRIAVRDLSDPFDVRREGRGGVNIVDLANLHSCAFIQTQDIGTVASDGSFTLDGRVTGSDIRGCNLLVQPSITDASSSSERRPSPKVVEASCERDNLL